MNQISELIWNAMYIYRQRQIKLKTVPIVDAYEFLHVGAINWIYLQKHKRKNC